MTTIGTFNKSGEDFQGEINTLGIRAAKVRIVKEETRATDASPHYRVMAGRAEIGAGWCKCDKNGDAYVSVKVDDPSFGVPLYANLFDDKDGAHSLVWNRPRAAA